MPYVLIFQDSVGERTRKEVDPDADLNLAVVDFVYSLPPLSDGDTIRVEEIEPDQA
jgi:hypothetical protein